MYVILDTNQIHKDYRLNRPITQELLKGAPARNIVVCIPEVVLAEMSADFRDEIKQAVDRLNGGHRELDRLRASEAATAPDISLDEEVEKYRIWLYQYLEQLKVWVLYVASDDLRLLFDKYVGRRRPFKERSGNDRARREPFFDTLIWLSVVQLARDDSNQQIYLISDDKAFADPKDTVSVHPDLRADLGVPEIEVQSGGRDQDLPRNPERAGMVQLYKNIEEFIPAWRKLTRSDWTLEGTQE